MTKQEIAEQKEGGSMSEHSYVLESAVPGSAYYWVIFCTKCGYVSWYGNSSNDSLAKLQANRPLECIGPATQIEVKP